MSTGAGGAFDRGTRLLQSIISVQGEIGRQVNLNDQADLQLVSNNYQDVVGGVSPNSTTAKKKTTTGAATSSAQSVSSQAPAAQQSVGVVDTTTRRGTGQGEAVVGLLSTIQKSLLGL